MIPARFEDDSPARIVFVAKHTRRRIDRVRREGDEYAGYVDVTAIFRAENLVPSVSPGGRPTDLVYCFRIEDWFVRRERGGTRQVGSRKCENEDA